jgi:micrococcal nuclease
VPLPTVPPPTGRRPRRLPTAGAPDRSSPSARRVPVLRSLTALAAVVALAVGCGWPPRPPARATPGAAAPGAGEATVVRVVDGDTLVAHLAAEDENLRLIGIDTPETKKPGAPVECFGAEASAHLAELLPAGATVRLERDVEDRDRYGRLLAYVHRVPDDLFVNQAMVADGYAAAYTVAPNIARTDELGEAARRARTAGLGLWGRCRGGHEPLPP